MSDHPVDWTAFNGSDLRRQGCTECKWPLACTFRADVETGYLTRNAH